MDSFENKSLNEAVYTAWIANPSLVAMAEQTLARGEEAVIAGASIIPQANLGVNGSRSKRNLIGFGFPNGSTSFTTESFSSGINLSWEVDLWGKLRDQRNSRQRKDLRVPRPITRVPACPSPDRWQGHGMELWKASSNWNWLSR